MKLSVIIPVYNEVNTIKEIIRRVIHTGLPHEIVVVDDGSNDETREILSNSELCSLSHPDFPPNY